MTLLFVYGTLKRGLENHRFMAGQAFAGEAATEPRYHLYQLDGYPGLVAAATGGESIRGELWHVDDRCLAALDVLEGTAEGIYARVPVALLEPHATLGAQTYLYLQATTGRARSAPDWRP
jgi:gamma-glutamylaminecyclotransferase